MSRALCLSIVLFLSLAAPLPALAQKTKTTTTYTRSWSSVCGGTTFVTCASVQLIVSGVNVEMRAWNLSGGTLGGSAGAVIRNIALLNVPGGLYSSTSTTTSGTYWTGSMTPYPYTITSTNSSTAAGSTGKIELSKYSPLPPKTRVDSLSNAFASSCAATTPGLIPSGTRLWMTQADGCSTSQIGTTSGTNYVTFNFSTNQAFDPNAMDIQLGITSIDMTSPMVTSYYEAYATPEPATLLLLGSGLLGVGGSGLARRRRRREALDASG